MDRPRRYRSLPVICLALASAALCAYAIGTGRRGVAYAGLGLLSICARWLLASRKPALWLLSPGVLLVCYYIWRAQFPVAGFPTGADGETFDLYALYVDGSFGFQPSIWMNQFFRSSLLRVVLQQVYEGLPFAMGIAYALWMTDREKATRLFGCFAVAGVLGMFCYNLLPICGPAYLPFGDECFYYRGSCSTAGFFAGTPTAIGIDLRWARNGFPSLHMAWALLIWWSCREKQFARWLTPAFATFTAFSTLVYGEHYLVDLLAAFFFALIPWSLCLAEGSVLGPSGGLAFAGGSLGYLTWVILVRYYPQVFWTSAVVPWAALVLSCVVPSVLAIGSSGKSRASTVCDARLVARQTESVEV